MGYGACGLCVVGLARPRGQRQAAPVLALRLAGRAISDCVGCVVPLGLFEVAPCVVERARSRMRQRCRSAGQGVVVGHGFPSRIGVDGLPAQRACRGLSALDGGARRPRMAGLPWSRWEGRTHARRAVARGKLADHGRRRQRRARGRAGRSSRLVPRKAGAGGPDACGRGCSDEHSAAGLGNSSRTRAQRVERPRRPVRNSAQHEGCARPPGCGRSRGLQADAFTADAPVLFATKPFNFDRLDRPRWGLLLINRDWRDR